ncbi:helix-turn-helix transcriptional regulator [Glutamicibacter sp. BW77]|uniref:helix-turn-helix domain-containing protein n=2 Tax=Micrococcaceae TaxID=1268 RepID=UPI00197AD7B5|nr:helix-turn-helix transcriptional regulator [Glutamicibacter sp. BW77]
MGEMDISREKSAKTALSLRKSTGLTQQDLANLLGTSSRTISRWESGETSIPAEKIRQIEYVITGNLRETTAIDLQFASSVNLGLEIMERLKRHDMMAAQIKELKEQNESYKIRYGEL